MTNLINSIGTKLSFSILLIALSWTLTIRVPTAIWIGPFSLNAYLTGIVVALAGLLAVVTLFFTRELTSGEAPQPKTPLTLSIGATSALPFLAYTIFILASDFRIEGFQNALVWAAFSFVLFALPLWLTDHRLKKIRQTLRVVVLLVPITKIGVFYADVDFYGEASYALVAALLLAYAVAQKPQAWFDYLGPWLLLFSILLCEVRTAAVIAAALMVFSFRHFPARKLVKIVGSLGATTVAFVLVWFAVGDRILGPGDPGFGPISTTNRAEGWAYLFDNLSAGTNWFGQGAGLSSYLVDELLGIHHPHNEYVRIFFDFGIFGLGLFLGGNLVLFIALVITHLRIKTELTFAPLLLLPTVALLALTDNPIVFSYVMVPAAVIISAALATSNLEQRNLAKSRDF